MAKPFRETRKVAYYIKKIPDKIYRVLGDKLRRKTVKLRSTSLIADYFADFKPKCHFIIDDQDKSKYLEPLRLWQQDSRIIEEADQLCNHIFTLLGSGNCYLGKSIEWNVDFKTGFRWRNQYYKDITLVDLDRYADVKVVWELSRFQHLFTLGKAYWLSRDEKYALEFGGQIEDWIRANPVEMSVNWTCAMDVAIRAINWIVAYYFFKDSPSLEPRFWMRFQKLLYCHGKFIKANLENRGLNNNNHYIADLAGLVWLGLYFGDHYVKGESASNNPKVWLVFGVSELEKELMLQVNRDGTDYELSTSYHRLVTEIFLLTTIFSVKNGVFYSRVYCNRIKKMVRFLMTITQPNGLTPLVGDADDGRLLIVSNYYSWDKRDFRYLLAIAGEFFDVDVWRLKGNIWREEALWTVGCWQEPESCLKQVKSKAFKQGGYYLLQNEKLYCLIRCGELSCRGEGGHSHNDQLSIVLSADQTDLIVDPGVYVYSADYLMRNLYRSTAVHNSLCIEGVEQNDFHPGNLFAMPEQSHGECLMFDAKNFTGRHYGYHKKLGIIHERSIRLVDDGIIIQDSLLGEPPLRLYWFLNFMLDPEVEVIFNEDDIQLKKNSWLVTLESGVKLDVKILKGLVSKGYGILERTKRLLVRSRDWRTNTLTLKLICRKCSRQLAVRTGISELNRGEKNNDCTSWAIS